MQQGSGSGKAMASGTCRWVAVVSMLALALRAVAQPDGAYLVGTGAHLQAWLMSLRHKLSSFAPCMNVLTSVAGIADVTGPAADVEMMVSSSNCKLPPPLRHTHLEGCLMPSLTAQVARCRGTPCRSRLCPASTRVSGRGRSSSLMRPTQGELAVHHCDQGANAVQGPTFACLALLLGIGLVCADAVASIVIR